MTFDGIARFEVEQAIYMKFCMLERTLNYLSDYLLADHREKHDDDAAWNRILLASHFSNSFYDLIYSCVIHGWKKRDAARLQ